MLHNLIYRRKKIEINNQSKQDKTYLNNQTSSPPITVYHNQTQQTNPTNQHFFKMMNKPPKIE